MERALAHYSKAMDIVAKIIMITAGLIIGLDVLSIFAEAVGRYLVGQSRAFMEELPRLAVPLVVFPMMGVLLKYKKHIVVDLLPEKLSGKARSLLLIVVHSLVLAVAIQFLIAGIIAVIEYRNMGLETHTEIVFKIWITYLPFPIGFFLLALFSLEMLWQELMNLIKLVKEAS
ncbi:MAG: TRAP transporter small permease subunit [Desulfarculaceae bacterium]|jgi:TRAP-type C4-dicarboxylate transport system permease small subunit